MQISNVPTPPEPRRIPPHEPERQPEQQSYTGQEDMYRGGLAGLSGVLGEIVENSRGLGHATDTTGLLNINNAVFNSVLGVASLGLATIDGLQARQAFSRGDNALGWINVVGGTAGVIGGGLNLAQAISPGLNVSEGGSLCMSVSVAADATEDLLEARRLGKPEYRVRALVKYSGAALVLAGALSGNPTVQLAGNALCLGGVVMHHAPKLLGLSSPPPER